MTEKTYLKDVSIVSVYDYKDFEKTFLIDVLAGVVIDDETFRFTSKIVNKRVVGDKIEVITHNGSCYVIDVEHKLYDISFAELVVMRIGVHSPERILEMREQLKTPKLN
jgi:GTP:adenosylcobinamide-phosphate guanylyltransferase